MTVDGVQGATWKEFNRLYHQFTALYREIAVRMHLSDSAFLILYSLFELGEGCSQKDICTLVCLNKQTVHSSVRKLEKDGYLRFVPGAGRAVGIYLTDAGKKLMEKTILPVVAAENHAFETMSSEEQKALLRSTGDYIALLRENIEKTLFPLLKD